MEVVAAPSEAVEQSTVMPCMRGVRRPRRTCVVAQRLRWHGVARRREERAPGHAGSAALIASVREVDTSWGVLERGDDRRGKRRWLRQAS